MPSAVRRAGAALGLLFFAALPSAAQDFFITSLAMESKLEIGLVEAVLVEKRLGQLLVVNVDGFGSTGPLAVSQDYLDLVERLEVGGVIPHYGTCSPSRIRATNAELRKRTAIPLLIASDIITLCAPDGSQASFGDGYVGGFIGKHRGLGDREFERLANLNAFVCRALGIGCALWPTVDSSTRDSRVSERARVVTEALRRFGILTTLKHWPFVPQGVDLHRESVDSALPLQEVERLAAVFRDASAGADLIMTTHVYDSLVDDSLVTLSPRWVRLLQASTGFSGPIMTDGLFMLRSHREHAALAEPLPGLGRSGDDEIAGWAAGAILAGHDMVIVEGTAATSRKVYERLLELACRADELGRRMRERIFSAYGKILALKERHASELAADLEVPAVLIDRIIAVVGRGAAGLSDGVAYAALEADIASSCRRLPWWRGG